DRLPSLWIDPLGPGDLLLILVGADELAVAAIERVVVAVAREVRDNLAGLAVDGGLIEHLRARRVEVPMLVRRLLEIPDDPGGVGVERDGARGEQIVTWPELGIEARIGVAGAIEQEVGGGIIGRGLPHAAAAHAPSIVLVLPGLGAGFARCRDGEGAP